MWKNLFRQILFGALVATLLFSTSAPSLACRACGAPLPTDQSEQVETKETSSDDSKEEREKPEPEVEKLDGKPPR